MGSLLVDRVKFNTSTTGTGTITVGAALANYCTPATADVPVADLSPLSLLIEDSGQVELSQGVYSATAGTITRSLVWSSTGALLGLSGAAVVSLTALAQDIANTSIVDVFTASGTWTKRPGLTSIFVTCIGAGGAGGSGRKGAAGTLRTGGGGGGGGGLAERHISATVLGATETVVVGPSLPGGASITANSSNGVNGTYGGKTSFGTRCSAQSGSPGLGGLATGAGSGGGGAAYQQYVGINGVASSATGGAGSSNYNGVVAGSGGGSGGGITTADVASAGGAGATLSAQITGIQSFGGGAAGGAIGTDGTAGANPAIPDTTTGGSGGGGGSSITGNAGKGGDGGLGCGGGGGGAALDGVGNSGAGGKGGPGLVIVFNYF